MRAANDQNLFRRTIEQEVERLLGILDGMDGDCDLEDGADKEPSFGWSDMEGRYGSYANGQEHDDREQEDENDEDIGDTEPNGDETDTNFTEDDGGVGIWQ
jgi:hypothetical protein